MYGHRVEPIAAALSYLEAHLQEKLDLDTLAAAACYSKYHLHRMFTDTLGMTPHDYLRRRRLTEAARLLVFSGTPILQLALAAGYESQQAFTSVFKAMYKRTPLAYRQKGVFYPLQLAVTLHEAPSSRPIAGEISYAAPDDLPDWRDFIPLVIDGFPCLDEPSHLEQVRAHMQRRQALLMRDGAVIIGAAACSYETGCIHFLATHPQYRHCGVAEAFLGFLARKLPAGRRLSITTFRAGDRADTGQRAEYRRLGFAESELLTEFGYPTQRLVLPDDRGYCGNGR